MEEKKKVNIVIKGTGKVMILLPRAHELPEGFGFTIENKFDGEFYIDPPLPIEQTD